MRLLVPARLINIQDRATYKCIKIMVIYRSGSRLCRAIYLLEESKQIERWEVINYFLITMQATIVLSTVLEFEYFRMRADDMRIAELNDSNNGNRDTP